MNARFPLSLKTKFFVIAAVIMALSSATWGGWAWFNEREHLVQKLTDNGRLLLTVLRAPIITEFVYGESGAMEDVGVLDTFVEEMMNTPGAPTVYAFITDDRGMVLSHNDFREYRTQASDPLTRLTLQGDHFVSSISRGRNGQRILDLGMPLRVAGKSWGTVRVGYSMAPLERELKALSYQVLSFSLLFFLLGTAVFYLIGVKMARPLVQLSKAMTALDLDSLEAVPEPQSRFDEIGELQGSFRNMVLRLQHSERERQLAISRLRNAERLSTIGEIVAGVAHEVNNPLAAISFSLSQIERKAAPELERPVGIVKAALSRIETIVRQLTEFGRAGSLELKRVQCSPFFDEVADFAAVALKKFPVRLLRRNELPYGDVSVDKGKMHQVMLNLLLNAAYVSPAGGVVELAACIEGEQLVFSVSDQGVGIAKDKLGTIFELFYTTKPAGEGTGIGLAVAKSIVELHRGEIVVESTPGRTVFAVKLPFFPINQRRP